MKRIGIHTSGSPPRMRYTVAFLNEHPLCLASDVRFALNSTPADNDLNIIYGSSTATEQPDLIIPAQQIFFASNHPALSTPKMNAYEYRGQAYYSVEIMECPAPQPAVLDGVFQFDLFEAIFYHISRYEEVFAVPDQIGPAGWLQEDLHLLVKEQLEKQPQVDRLTACLLELVTERKPQLPTRYDLSHDIDLLYRYPDGYALVRALGGALYRREGLTTMYRHVQRYMAMQVGKALDPYNCFEWLFSTDSGWTQKRLYLMTGGETTYDNHYAIKDPFLDRIVRLARSRGYELGLHPSYNAGMQSVLFQSELNRLRQFAGEAIHKSRQHWLRFDWQITPAILTKHHIHEDASMGYGKRLGFRCGTGFPYQMYDFSKERAYGWRESPLACMESAAIHEAGSTGKDIVVLLKDFFQANAWNTHLSINFHNSNFDPALAVGRQLTDFYIDFLLPLGK